MRPHPQESEDSVTFTDKVLNGKLHFLFSAISETFWENWSKCCPSKKNKNNSKIRQKSFAKSQWHSQMKWDSFSAAKMIFMQVKNQKKSRYKVLIEIYPQSIHLKLIWPCTYNDGSRETQNSIYDERKTSTALHSWAFVLH